MCILSAFVGVVMILVLLRGGALFIVVSEVCGDCVMNVYFNNNS